ncbi:MAG: sulfotransferase domain-containing protein [Crocosphaera sp.]|nr:sulfotransferase domain-containing protein [Crocosphaera sp.]
MLQFLKKLTQINHNQHQSRRILITGVSKSGTTALYSRVKNSLATDCIGYFEKLGDIEKQMKSSKDIIAKLILYNVFCDNWYEVIDNLFEKKILIVRDPRDVWISDLLYFGGYKHLWSRDKEEIQKALKLLENKEKNPDSSSVLELFENMKDDFERQGYGKYWKEKLGRAITFADNKDCIIVKYENFINDINLEELEDYLSIKLVKETQVSNNFKRVIRTKNSGDWKNWFVSEDINYFQPLCVDYMNRFNYDDDWKIKEDPQILAQYASMYVKKLINQKRKQNNLEVI